MIGPLLVDMSKDLSVSIPIMSQLTAPMAIVWLLVAFIAGPISDMYGRKTILLLGLIGTIIGAIGTSFAWGFGSAIGFRAISGLGGVVPPISTAAITDLTPPNHRGKAVGFLTAGGGLAAVIGVPIITFIADISHWRWSFISVGLSTSLIWIVLFFFLHNTKPVQSFGDKSLIIRIFSRYLPLIRQRIIWNITAVNTFQRIGSTVLITYFAPFLIIKYGFTTGETALPMGIVSFGLIIAGFMGGLLAESPLRLKAIPIGLILSAVLGVLIFVFIPIPYFAVALGLLYVTCIYFIFPLSITLFITISGAKLRGTVMTLMPISNQAGIIIGPALAGMALSFGGYEAIGIVCLSIGIVGAILTPFLLKEDQIQKATNDLASYSG